MRRLAAAFALLLSASLHAQEDRTAKLRELCLRHLQTERIVGMSVTVTDGNTVLLSEGVGLADRSSGRPVDSTTLFRLGSISKTITAVGFLKLVQEGKIDLQEDIRTYVPEFPDKNAKITPWHILTHSAGIRHYIFGRSDNGYDEIGTDRAIDKFKNDPLVSLPGAKFTYSTPAFTLLARAIETTTHRTFVSYMRSEILPKVGDGLDYEVASLNKPARSNLYIREPDAIIYFPKRENLSWKYAGGGMEGTSMAVLRFCNAVRNGDLLTPEMRDRMWTSTTFNDGSVNRYGLGWVVREDGKVHHGGSQQGCSSFVVFDPKTGAGAVILANTQNVDVGKLADQLLAVATGTPVQTRRRAP